MKLDSNCILPDSQRFPLIELLSEVMRSHKADELPYECERLNLDSGTAQEAHRSKRNYVKSRLLHLSNEEILAVAQQVQSRHASFSLGEFLNRLIESDEAIVLTDLTRREILSKLNSIVLFGELSLTDHLKQIWPQYSAPIDFSILFGGPKTPPQEQTNSEILEKAGALSCSRRLFFQFLEALVSPNVRRGEEQARIIALLNDYLIHDGFALKQTGLMSGHTLYTVERAGAGVSGKPKNLIFAANGPKPEIVIQDAVNNDIRIVKNEEFCLIYDREIGANGLRKGELIAWWKDSHQIEDEQEARRSLSERLKESLASDGEKNIFKGYYYTQKGLGDKLPALIPQVYLHYDPYTLKQLQGNVRLARQRMDFLILFSATIRVVIEVDGKHHFSTDDEKASLKVYADMMSADRDLRLAGYEVYRFGANELVGNGSGELIKNFFDRLIKKHI